MNNERPSAEITDMDPFGSVLVFDTSIASRNLGDHIIMDSVRSELSDMLRNTRFFNTCTHESISKTSYTLNRRCDISIVGGTNLLSSNMHSYNQWKINLVDA